MSTSPGWLKISLMFWIWVVLFSLVWCHTEGEKNFDYDPPGTQTEGRKPLVSVWQFLQVLDHRDDSNESDFAQPQYRCGEDALLLRFSLIRHTGLHLEGGSQPDGCNSSVDTFKSWRLLKLPYAGCYTELWVQPLKVHYFDQLLKANVTALASCKIPEPLPAVTCGMTSVTVRLPLETTLKRIRALHEDDMIQNKTQDAVVIVTSDMDSILEFVYFDSEGDTAMMLAGCLAVRRHPRQSPEQALKDKELWELQEMTFDLYNAKPTPMESQSTGVSHGTVTDDLLRRSREHHHRGRTEDSHHRDDWDGLDYSWDKDWFDRDEYEDIFDWLEDTSDSPIVGHPNKRQGSSSSPHNDPNFDHPRRHPVCLKQHSDQRKRPACATQLSHPLAEDARRPVVCSKYSGDGHGKNKACTTQHPRSLPLPSPSRDSTEDVAVDDMFSQHPGRQRVCSKQHGIDADRLSPCAAHPEGLPPDHARMYESCSMYASAGHSACTTPQLKIPSVLSPPTELPSGHELLEHIERHSACVAQLPAYQSSKGLFSDLQRRRQGCSVCTGQQLLSPRTLDDYAMRCLVCPTQFSDGSGKHPACAAQPKSPVLHDVPGDGQPQRHQACAVHDRAGTHSACAPQHQKSTLSSQAYAANEDEPPSYSFTAPPRSFLDNMDPNSHTGADLPSDHTRHLVCSAQPGHGATRHACATQQPKILQSATTMRASLSGCPRKQEGCFALHDGSGRCSACSAQQSTMTSVSSPPLAALSGDEQPVDLPSDVPRKLLYSLQPGDFTGRGSCAEQLSENPMTDLPSDHPRRYQGCPAQREHRLSACPTQQPTL